MPNDRELKLLFNCMYFYMVFLSFLELLIYAMETVSQKSSNSTNLFTSK